MATRFVLPFADVGSGILPSSGAQLFFFETGTNNDKDTFTDSDTAIPNTNPVIADSKGLFPDIFVSGVYKVVLKDKNGSQKWEADPVGEIPTTQEPIELTDGQVDVVFTKVNANTASIYIQGDNVDRGLLLKNTDIQINDYAVTGDFTIKLTSSYPDKSVITAFGTVSVDSGAVVSVHGRTGVVSSVSGDYNASQITNTPAGNITAVEQQAVNAELDALIIASSANSSTVIPHTGAATLTALRTNEIHDGSTYTLPLANSILVNQTITVTLPDRYSAFTPLVQRAGADTITDSVGASNDILLDSGSVSFTLTSDGVSNWTL